MNRLASALSLALVFTLVSCGDDDKPKADGSAGTGGTAGSTGGSGGSTGGSGGSTGGSGGTTACTGTFAGINQAQLAGAIAMSTGDKKCAAATDVALICTSGIATIAGQCGIGCASGPTAMFKTCTTTCIKSMVNLSEACGGCYADTVACAQMNCLNVCLAGSSSPACVQCQIDKGCRSAFLACTGLPGGAPADGGAGDGGGTTGDGGAIDAASTEGGTTADGGAADVAVTSDTAVTADTAVTSDTAVTADTAVTDDTAAAADTAASTDSSTD